MADIKRLLNKKGWTGRELGILEITNMCILFRQLLAGKEQKPLVEEAQFRKMLSTLDGEQGPIYNGYMLLHSWLTIRWNMAQTQYQQALRAFRTLSGYMERAELAEDVFGYAEQLPAIVTQKQYDDLKAERIEAQFKDEEGEELAVNVFYLIERAIHFYLEQLQKEPRKANPLKAIRKKYINQPVKSKLILSRWGEVTGEGYYTIEDGSGRRSDEMTLEEWENALIPDRAALENKDNVVKRILAGARVLYNGGTEEEAEKAMGMQCREDGLFPVPVQWHDYEEAPDDLTKWDVVEQEIITGIYPADIDGSGDAWSDENFTNSMKDFAGEFPELVAAILKDIDKRYFKEADALSGLPVEEWMNTLFDVRQLYEKDFYGERAFVESDAQIFSDNRRALFNGIAILRPSDVVGRGLAIDERGYYKEPGIKSALATGTLEGLFAESEDYADHVDIVESSRQTLIESYYFLKGHNCALELIGRVYDVPDVDVFKMDLEGIERKIQALNDITPCLYDRIRSIDYEDTTLQEKKLQVLQDLFQPIDYKALTIPEKNKKAAEELFHEGFKVFSGGSTIESLLCFLPEKGGDAEEGGRNQ